MKKSRLKIMAIDLRKLLLPAAAVALLSIPGAFAQEAAKTAPGGEMTSQEEIQQFCTNIADPARDQRYLIQKQALEKLQADVDSRVAILEQRRAEYQDWLKRRNDFLQQAQASLVDIYKNMKPDTAALQLQDANVGLAAAIVMKLQTRQASLIMNEMDPQKAAAIVNIIASAVDPNTSKGTQ